jgi:hypothetical protein
LIFIIADFHYAFITLPDDIISPPFRYDFAIAASDALLFLMRVPRSADSHAGNSMPHAPVAR